MATETKSGTGSTNSPVSQRAWPASLFSAGPIRSHSRLGSPPQISQRNDSRSKKRKSQSRLERKSNFRELAGKKRRECKTFEGGNFGVSVPDVKKIHIMRITHGNELATIRAHHGWKKI